MSESNSILKRAALVILLLLGAVMFPALAQAQFTYTTNADSTLTITGYTGPAGAVTFPTNINGLTVSGIASLSFAGNTNLIDVTIPGSITNIAQDAFDSCTGLTNVMIGEGCTTIPAFAFEQCVNLSGVTLPSTLKSIGQFAFLSCHQLTSLTIPPSVGTIAGSTFIQCGFTNFTLPNTVTNLGGNSFAICTKLANFTFSPGPNLLTGIGSGVFEGCAALTNVMISSNVTVIGDYMFQGCVNLAYLPLPSSLRSIGVGAFQSAGLTNIIIPISVTYLGTNAFTGCAYLTNAIILGNCTISDSAFCQFVNNSGGGVNVPLQSVYIAGGTIGYRAFYFCTNLSSLTLGDQVSDIGELAFSETALKSVVIPGSCTHIGVSAFDNLGLTNLILGEGVQTIDGYAFTRNLITTLSLPASLRTIGEEGFSDNPITNLFIPYGLTTIGNQCFQAAQAPYITVPSSLTNIGTFLNFALNPNLTAMLFLGSAPAAGDGNTFLDDNTNLVVYHLPGTSGWSNTFDGIPTAIWNPTLQKHDGNFGLRNGRFGFNVTGPTNLPVAIQACTNLASGWTMVTNVTLTNGSFYFSDPQPAIGSTGFYRLSPPP